MTPVLGIATEGFSTRFGAEHAPVIQQAMSGVSLDNSVFAPKLGVK